MEPVTLVTTAIAMVSPYLLKTGEAIAEKIGEDIWNIIKKPFAKELKVDIIKDKEQLNHLLLQKIDTDPAFREELQNAVAIAQNKLDAYYQQNVNNTGQIEKQINIQNNTGNIQM